MAARIKFTFFHIRPEKIFKMDSKYNLNTLEHLSPAFGFVLVNICAYSPRNIPSSEHCINLYKIKMIEKKKNTIKII